MRYHYRRKYHAAEFGRRNKPFHRFRDRSMTSPGPPGSTAPEEESFRRVPGTGRAFRPECLLGPYSGAAGLCVHRILAHWGDLYHRRPAPETGPGGSAAKPGRPGVYESYTASRESAIQRIKRKFDNIDQRIRRMEHTVTSRDFDL